VSRIEVIGNAALYLGDCAEILPTLQQADAVITDPPYGIKANKQTLGKGKKEFHRGESWDDAAPDLALCLAAGRLACFWGGNYFADQLPISNDWLIWHKLNDGRSFSECEMAWTNFGRQTRHLSHNWSGEEKLHPTQKPLAVMLWCVGQVAAQTVVDPFMGSGTTGVACIQLGRSFVGIEREPAYFELACRRIEQAQKQSTLFAAGELS
jgi:site-specific DNA-methyltransferase (adenine-specific)/modification methylase